MGFIQILGHAIPDSAIAGMASTIDAFFALPPETKRTCCVTGANRGYSPRASP
ncbi:2-oxoglutarate and iron-dependent oxygenase domain-containing protein [Streptomyces sp. NPDC006365]|uniref:2-oxoglutarate and iron-dependent oxygenase domain-containing protein n=1 Tax=Streptomyces sp. NPDC006365 TaxID=3364744 RepID=UPI0036AA5328